MGKTLSVVPNYRPHKKQVLLHNAPVTFDSLSIVLYGGSRGGGKSAGILADAVFFATTYPGAKICILRESLDAVKQSFLDKLPTLFPQEIEGHKIYEYKEKSSSINAPLSRSVIFPNGSYITFQRVANYQEAITKQGWEFHYLGIDEVTKQDEKTVMYLLSTVRSVIVDNPYTKEKMKIPTKIVFGCNPGGIGHKWVKEKYIDTTVVKYDPESGAPLQTKDHVEIFHDPIKKKDITCNVRFIPASWRDNPFLSDAYFIPLSMQSETKRKMDMDGNWDVVAGKMFDFQPEHMMHPTKVNSILTNPNIPKDIYITIDWGYGTDMHSAIWIMVLSNGKSIAFREMYNNDLVFEDFVEEIRRVSGDLEITATLLPHDMFRGGDRYRNSDGVAMGETKAEVFEFYGLSPIPVQSGKGTVDMRYDKLHSSFKITLDKGEYRHIISSRCENLIDELENAVHDDNGSGKIDKSCDDHALDSYGLFLVFYSSDIAPIDLQDIEIDDRSKFQKKLDDEEEALDAGYSDGYIDVDEYEF